MSIRSKLVATIMAATTAAVMVACAGFAIYDLAAARQALVSEQQADASMLALNATAALSFSDANDAAATLSSLRADPAVEAAAFFATDGRMLAPYARDPSLRALVPASPVAEGSRFGTDKQGRFLETVRPVEMDGRLLGTVYVRCDLRALEHRTRQYALILAVVLAGSLSVALALAARMQRFITRPVLHLADTARQIAQVSRDGAWDCTRDRADRRYVARAVKTTADEVGLLTDCFNEMLDQVEARDAQLRSHREHLEEEVGRRTAELTATNTRLAAMNGELSAAKSRAEEASAAKTAFLANMSHEIRTPMTAIVGYADLMLSPSQTMSDRINSLQVIRRNARHLMELINDILDISKIEAEKMTTERIDCDPAQVAVDVASMLRPRAMEKGLNLAVAFEGPIPARIQSDPLRLKQVLVNLVGNAIKFTTAGEVRLRVRVGPAAIDGPNPGAGRMEFDIEDTGIGMSAGQVAKLFRPFVQADESMTRKFGGTGLGLVISKRLAALMGGDIAVRSESGRGSTFSLCVDAGPLEGVEMRRGLTESVLQVAPEPTDGEEIRLTGARILLAEDGPDNQHLITLYLSGAGAKVTVAENGRVALEKLRAEPFDLVLMDMQMPELDGYSAAAAARQRGLALPIVALTAHAMSGDRERCLAAGCTDYLTKPIEPDLLLRTIASYLERTLADNAAPPPAPSAPEPVGQVGDVLRSRVQLPRSAAAAAAMRQAVVAFVDRLPERVRLLQEALSAGAIEDLCRLAHQLKGAGAGYGFPEITERAARAEKAVREAAGSESAGRAVEEVRGEVDALVALIRRVEGYRAEREAARA